MKIKTGNYIVRDKELLKTARNIFGVDGIEDAFISCRFYEHEIHNDDYYKNQFDDAKHEIELGDISIKNDTTTIVLVFKGENYIDFSASEWSTITKVDKNDYILFEE